MPPVLGSLLDLLALRIRQEELSIMYHYNYYYTYLGIPLVSLIGIQSSLFYLLRSKAVRHSGPLWLKTVSGSRHLRVAHPQSLGGSCPGPCN